MSSDYDILSGNVKAVLETSSGREVLWEILSMCNLYSSSFTGDNRTFFEEGKRAVGLDILQLIEDADPKAYGNLLITKQEDRDNG